MGFRACFGAACRLVGGLSFLVACSAAPQRAPEEASDAPRPLGKRRDLPDDCEQQPGKPPPEPLAREYTGVAAKARCQREVYTIMGGVAHFLDVDCTYCHVKDDYPAMTHRKHVANWMARELIPRLEKPGGGEVWCNDCHLVRGKGRAKILKDPRDPAWTIEWMTTHVVAEFEQPDGSALHCKGCHGGNLGSPEFEKNLILPEGAPVEPAPPPGSIDAAGSQEPEGSDEANAPDPQEPGEANQESKENPDKKSPPAGDDDPSLIDQNPERY